MPTRENSFDMPTLRIRAKRTVKERFGKTIKLSDVDRLLGQYVKYGIIKLLVRDGKVQIDERFSIEIVGQRIEDNKRLTSLMIKELNFNGIVKKAVKFNPNRAGIAYKIECVDKSYEGQLIFTPNKDIKKAVSISLSETQTYYRIKK